MRTRKSAPYERCMHILGEVLWKQGKVAESVPALREAVQGRIKDGNTLWLGLAADDLADQLVDLRKPAEAADALREANVHLSRQKSLPPAEHWSLACRCARQCRLVQGAGNQHHQTAEAVQIALTSLRAALLTKHNTPIEVERDAALDPLSADPAFHKMMVEIKSSFVNR